jgi:hypothetical protein
MGPSNSRTGQRLFIAIVFTAPHIAGLVFSLPLFWTIWCKTNINLSTITQQIDLKQPASGRKQESFIYVMPGACE